MGCKTKYIGEIACCLKECVKDHSGRDKNSHINKHHRIRTPQDSVNTLQDFSRNFRSSWSRKLEENITNQSPTSTSKEKAAEDEILLALHRQARSKRQDGVSKVNFSQSSDVDGNVFECYATRNQGKEHFDFMPQNENNGITKRSWQYAKPKQINAEVIDRKIYSAMRFPSPRVVISLLSHSPVSSASSNKADNTSHRNPIMVPDIVRSAGNNSVSGEKALTEPLLLTTMDRRPKRSGDDLEEIELTKTGKRAKSTDPYLIEPLTTTVCTSIPNSWRTVQSSSSTVTNVESISKTVTAMCQDTVSSSSKTVSFLCPDTVTAMCPDTIKLSSKTVTAMCQDTVNSCSKLVSSLYQDKVYSSLKTVTAMCQDKVNSRSKTVTGSCPNMLNSSSKSVTASCPDMIKSSSNSSKCKFTKTQNTKLSVVGNQPTIPSSTAQCTTTSTISLHQQTTQTPAWSTLSSCVVQTASTACSLNFGRFRDFNTTNKRPSNTASGITVCSKISAGKARAENGLTNILSQSTESCKDTSSYNEENRDGKNRDKHYSEPKTSTGKKHSKDVTKRYPRTIRCYSLNKDVIISNEPSKSPRPSPASSGGEDDIKDSVQRCQPLNLQMVTKQCEFMKNDGADCGAPAVNKFCEYHVNVLAAVDLFLKKKSTGNKPFDVISLINEENNPGNDKPHPEKGSAKPFSEGVEESVYSPVRVCGGSGNSVDLTTESPASLSPTVLVPNRFKYVQNNLRQQQSSGSFKKVQLPPTVKKILSKNQIPSSITTIHTVDTSASVSSKSPSIVSDTAKCKPLSLLEDLVATCGDHSHPVMTELERVNDTGVVLANNEPRLNANETVEMMKRISSDSSGVEEEESKHKDKSVQSNAKNTGYLTEVKCRLSELQSDEKKCLDMIYTNNVEMEHMKQEIGRLQSIMAKASSRIEEINSEKKHLTEILASGGCPIENSEKQAKEECKAKFIALAHGFIRDIESGSTETIPHHFLCDTTFHSFTESEQKVVDRMMSCHMSNVLRSSNTQPPAFSSVMMSHSAKNRVVLIGTPSLSA